MVLSVFAMSFAFVGTAAATASGTESADGTRIVSDGNSGFVDGDTILAEGASVFRGEELRNASASTATDFSNAENSETNLTTSLIHIETGEQLEGTIPQDATLGAYTETGDLDGYLRVDVRTATISEFAIENPNEADVSGGVLVNADDTAETGYVNATYNFNASEPLEVTVTDADGFDVTTEFIQGSTVDDETRDGLAVDEASFRIADDVDTGTYTVTVAGSDDLDFGDATQSATIEIVDSADVSVSLQPEEVVQGNSVQFTLTGGTEGDYHLVTIADDDFRSVWDDDFAGDTPTIFRDVSDVTDTGYLNASDPGFGGEVNVSKVPAGATDAANVTHAFAILEIDGGQAIGAIDTTYLDTDDITIDVYNEDVSGDVNNDWEGGNYANDDGTFGGIYSEDGPPEVVRNLADVGEEDDIDLTVTEGGVTLDSPSGTYVIGSQVDITGSVTEGVEDVAIYVRGGSDWERLDLDISDAGNTYTIDVDSDNTFELEDVTLSDTDSTDGNQLLSLPGSYKIAVVDFADLNGPNEELTTAQFNDNTTDSQTIVVTSSDLSAQFEFYNGQADRQR
jgi:major cell surface glycoprotein (TIGR04216 family)